MIHWLVQSVESYPTSSNEVVVLDGILHPREQARFETLKTEKRRRDWLLGRWTAKQLIGEIVAQETGERLPPDTIEVQNGAMGDPIVNFQLLTNKRQSSVTLSISHSNSHAFCALVEKPEWPLGADIEQISNRSEEFVTDYFTKEEQALVTKASTATRDMFVTAVWSAKEAVLKALHLGLTVDTRSVTCLLEPMVERPLTWTPFTILCDNSRLPKTSPKLVGWWRTYAEFVLTLVVQEEEATNRI